jgi:hypothetical protein
MKTWAPRRLHAPHVPHRQPVAEPQRVVVVALRAAQPLAPHVRSRQHRLTQMMILMTAIPSRISRI